MNILALIPARAGSKGIPNKNIRLINGRPLISYTVEHARRIKDFNIVAVSSDSKAIIEEAARVDYITPILRPSRFATDTAGMNGVMKHALQVLMKKDYKPEMVVLLQPTSPIRSVSTTLRAIRTFEQWWYDYDCLVPLTPISGKVGSVTNNLYKPFYPIGKNRQTLKPTYMECGNIFIFKAQSILKNKPYGKYMYPFIIDNPNEAIDIDTEDDMKAAEGILGAR